MIKPKLVSMEGNIGAGKTSMIRAIKDRITTENRDDLTVLEEPIEEWMSINDGTNNILHLFYKNPTEYAFLFQVLVGITTMKQLKKAVKKNPALKVILSERSLLSSRKIFAESLIEADAMDGIESEIYDILFSDDDLEWMYPTGMIYLKTRPEVCLERIEKRGRWEEESITIEWLRQCEQKHEKMIDEADHIVSFILDGNATPRKSRDKLVTRVLEWGTLCAEKEVLKPAIGKGQGGSSMQIPLASPKKMTGEYAVEVSHIRVPLASKGDVEEEYAVEVPTTGLLASPHQLGKFAVEVRYREDIRTFTFGKQSYDGLLDEIKDNYRSLKNRRKTIRLAWVDENGTEVGTIGNNEELKQAVATVGAQDKPLSIMVLLDMENERVTVARGSTVTKQL
jgi:deoxyadenosine/deoxycytidine kinase